MATPGSLGRQINCARHAHRASHGADASRRGADRERGLRKGCHKMPHFIQLIDSSLNLKKRFDIKKFKYTKTNLTRDERILLRRKGTKLQAFKERAASSTSEEYRHFMEVCTHDA